MTRRVLCMLCAGMLLMTGCGMHDMTAAETEISGQIAEETAPATTEATSAETTSAETTFAETDAEPDLTYEIGGGREDAERLAQYNESVQYTQGLLRGANYADGEYSAETFARIEAFLQPIDGLCVFPVTLNGDGADSTEYMYMYVIRLDGVWMVDLLVTESLDDDFVYDTEPEDPGEEIVVPESVTLTDTDGTGVVDFGLGAAAADEE